MLGPSWIALFERIPARLHDTLALTLVTGAEIMMQSVLRLESEYAILRGRMAGSTDAGRVIIVPYQQIVNVAFTKRMLEPEVEAVFGKTLEQAAGHAPAAEDTAAAGSEAAEAEGADGSNALQPVGSAVAMRTSQLNPPPPPGPATAPGKNPQAPPSKSILLARLRARLAEQGK